MRTVPSASCRCHDLRLRAHQWRLSALDPFPEAFKQRCGTNFYYNRAAIAHVPRLLQCVSTSRKGIKRKICGSIMAAQGE
jgi:hypothetical protein